MDAANVVSTTYEPLYYIWDQSLLGEGTIAELKGLMCNETAAPDFMAITRDEIDAGGGGAKGGKKPPAKGKKEEAEEEEEDDSPFTVNEQMVAALKEIVQKEQARRQELLYAKRRASIEELQGAKGNAAKGAKGAKAAAKAPAKGGKKDVADVAAEHEPVARNPALPTSYPATVPLHVHLDGIIKKVGDVEKLLEFGVLLNFVGFFKTPQEISDKKDLEFQYGHPLQEEQDEKSEQPEEEQQTRFTIPQFEPSLIEQILALKKSKEEFKDLGLLDVEVPQVLVDAKKAEEHDGESRPETSASKKGGAPKKSAKAPKKEEGGKGSDDAPMDELCTGSLLALRQASQDLSDFREWRKDAVVKEIPSAVPVEEMDLRLYDNLMAKVPDSCCSVSLLLHCMFEQVAASVANRDLKPMLTNQKIDKLESYLDDALSMILVTNMADDEEEEEATEPAPPVEAEDEVDIDDDDAFEAAEVPVDNSNVENPPVPNIGLPQQPTIAPVAANTVPELEFCPATMGEPCEYIQGCCINCGVTKTRPASKASVHDGDNIITMTMDVQGADNLGDLGGPSGSLEDGEFCPASMGEPCQFDSQNQCTNCGQHNSLSGGGPDDGANFFDQDDDNIVPRPRPGPSTSALRLNGPMATIVLKYGDKQRINQALACLSAGKSWEEFPLTDEVENMIGYARLPGVSRAGMPSSSGQSVTERGTTRTEMLNRSQLPAEIFERGLMQLSLEEMLDDPGPSIDFSLHKQAEFFHVDHLYREAGVVEEGVMLKIKELREKAETAGEASIGEVDEIVEQATLKWDWHLGDREYREEIAPGVLPQVLATALDPTNTVHTQARYEPLDDSLYVVMHARTPLTRRRVIEWNGFLCPQMNYSDWVKSDRDTKKMKPDTLFAFNNGHTGTLKNTASVMYPRDGARAGLTTAQSGPKRISTVWVKKDEEIFYMRESGVAVAAGEPANLSVCFADKSSMTVTCSRDEDGEVDSTPELSFTTVSGMVVSIRADGKVYMSYPGEVVRAQKKLASTGGQKDVTDPEVVKETSKIGVGKQGEEWRCVNSNGVVIKKMLNQSSIVLLPDANISTYDGASEQWLTVNNNGEKMATKLDGSSEVVGKVEVATQVDPESGAAVTTREDLAMLIRYRDGSTLAQHGDGTRIYTDLFPEEKKRHLVEGPDFPPVTVDIEKKLSLGGVSDVVPRTGATGRNLRTLERKTGQPEKGRGVTAQWEKSIQINLYDGTIIKKRAPQGGVIVTRSNGARIICCPNGKVVYVPKTLPPELFPTSLANAEYEEFAIPRESYTFNLLDGSLKSQDNDDNKYNAALSGVCDAKLSREQGVGADASTMLEAKYFPPPENVIQPRIFVIRGDGSASELLSPTAVEEYLSAVSKNPRCRQLPAEPLESSVTSRSNSFDRIDIDGHAEEINETLSLKFLEALPAPVAYNRKPVIPNIVKAAPNVLIAEHSKPTHNFIIYRHLIRTPKLTAEQRDQVVAEKLAYAAWKAEQAQNDMDFLTTDPRPPEQIEEEKRLQIEVLTARARRKEQKLSSNLSDHDALASINAESSSRPITTDGVNLGATLSSIYEPEQKMPVTTLPLTSVGPDGTREPIKFFANKPSASGKKSGRAHVATAKATAGAGSTRKPKGKSAPELAPFFNNAVFGQRYGVHEIMQSLRLCCHPLYKEGMTEEDLKNELADLPAGEETVKENEHYYKIASVVEGIQQMIKLVSRIFHSPHDPTLRTVDLTRGPYVSIVESSDIIAAFAKPILETLGFEGSGILVLMKDDDLFVKDGTRTLLEHLKELVKRPSTAGSKPAPVDTVLAPASDDDEDTGDALDGEPMVDNTQHSKAYLEREARMKANLTSPHVHGRGSFQYDNFVKTIGAQPPSYEGLEARIGALNVEYIERETAAKRPTKTASTINRVNNDLTAAFTDFEFSPSLISMGDLALGSTYSMSCVIKNVGVETGFFQIPAISSEQHPQLVSSAKFRPGALAPGMSKLVKVQVHAGELGEFNLVLQIRTEKATLDIPITGTVVNSVAKPIQGSKRHHVPPLESAGSKFGPVGAVRLESTAPSPRTAATLKKLRSQDASKPVETVAIDPSLTLEEMLVKNAAEEAIQKN